MIALGVQNDAPPIPLQPALPDGIHLRWAFPRARGFPWYGYYLFRRPHENRGARCVTDDLRALRQGPTGSNTLMTRHGVFSSDTSFTLTNDFPDPTIPEVTLRGHTSVRFDMPTAEPAFRLELRLGFY